MAESERDPPEGRSFNGKPFAIRMRVHLRTTGDLGDLKSDRLDLLAGKTLTITEAKLPPWDGGVDRMLTVVGFPTHEAAADAGKRLTQALFSLAIGLNVPIKIEYTQVVDRREAGGWSTFSHGTTHHRPERIKAYLADALSYEPVSDALLLSLELFNEAEFHATQEVKFLLMVAALEPLITREQIGDAGIGFVDRTLKNLEADPAMSVAEKDVLKNGLHGLKRESITRAVKRLFRDVFPNEPQAETDIGRAYTLRSQIVHSGRVADSKTNLVTETQTLSHWMRRFYGRRLPNPEPGTPQ